MEVEKIERIIAKYRKLAESSYDDEKIYLYERFADYIEENRDIFIEDDFIETEEELMDNYKEAEAEFESQWEAMFPEGDEDDSITDYMTD